MQPASVSLSVTGTATAVDWAAPAPCGCSAGSRARCEARLNLPEGSRDRPRSGAEVPSAPFAKDASVRFVKSLSFFPPSVPAATAAALMQEGIARSARAALLAVGTAEEECPQRQRLRGVLCTCGREAAEGAKDRNQEGRAGRGSGNGGGKRGAYGNALWRFRAQRTDGMMRV